MGGREEIGFGTAKEAQKIKQKYYLTFREWEAVSRSNLDI
jgi:hypothetical protein